MDIVGTATIFWIAVVVVAVAGIVAGVITNAVNKSSDAKKHLADSQAGLEFRTLAEEAVAANHALADRLAEIESRLGAIEKTLTDIP